MAKSRRRKYVKRYFVFALLVVFVLCPCIGWFDYWICKTKGWDSEEQWDEYTYNYGWLILFGFGLPISYVFASDPIAGKADGCFAFLVILTALLCTITDAWFWLLRGIVEKLPTELWFPPENQFPDILPWRLFGVIMTTSLHLKLVALGFLLIFGGTYAFTKKYVS